MATREVVVLDDRLQASARAGTAPPAAHLLKIPRISMRPSGFKRRPRFTSIDRVVDGDTVMLDEFFFSLSFSLFEKYWTGKLSEKISVAAERNMFRRQSLEVRQPAARERCGKSRREGGSATLSAFGHS